LSFHVNASRSVCVLKLCEW